MQAMQGIGEADLVLHVTDALFDPPPPSFPRHHHHVGPLLWEPVSEAPPYLDVPGAPWVLVTVSSLPQPEEMTLAATALRTLAALPVRVVLTLSPEHPHDELGPIPANAWLERFVPHSAVLKRGGLLVSHARGMASWPKPSTTACLWSWCPGAGISLVWPPVRRPSGGGSDCATRLHGAAALNRHPAGVGLPTLPGNCGTYRRPLASTGSRSAGACTDRGTAGDYVIQHLWRRIRASS